MMRKWKLWAAFCLLTIGANVYSQNAEIQKYGNRITANDLRDYLTILSSDALEGRETGKRGQKMAAAFIRAHFEELDLQAPVNGDYYQTFDLYTTRPGDNYVIVGRDRFPNFTDVVFYGNSDSGGEVSLPLIFGGNGSDEALGQLGDLKGKAIFLLAEGEFPTNDSLQLLRAKGVKMIFVSHSKSKADFDLASNQIRSFSGKRDLSLQKPLSNSSVPGVFIVSPLMTEKFFGLPRNELIKIMEGGYNKSAFKKIKPIDIKYRTFSDLKPIKTENVLGFLEGSDKKEEVIVITAHYDHVGVKKDGVGDLIHNGADDDGSGTAAVMELAKIFAEAKKDGRGPRRSILFMLVTAEEKGLLGSDYYTQNPVFPLENTVVNLNIDMIGRRDFNHRDSPPYVYVIGADKLSSDLNNVSETIKKVFGGKA